jgi:hypothetical protein
MARTSPSQGEEGGSTPLRATNIWSVRLARSRTSPFHGEDTGSNPVRTTKINFYIKYNFSIFVYIYIKMEKYWQRLVFKYLLISYLLFFPIFLINKFQIIEWIYPIFVYLAFKIFKMKIVK